MKQSETFKYIVEILKEFGPLPTRKISDEMFKRCDTDGYDFRWGQQKLKRDGIIDIDKSVKPALWYLR